MKNSYLFYDIETSGLNKCFDQVLQFAAIRTDLELNELARHEIFIKLNPDTIPSVQAILVHQLDFSVLANGVCEYEAMREIHELLNAPGTISLGYNTLGFDDEFLRFSFYRNLLTPYTHQYANGCGRMDLYPVVAMYYLFKPDVLSWPKIDAVPTLKLEHLSAQNNLAQGDAHNAMVDVEATLALAKILKKEREMWEYLCGYFNKKTDLERLEKLNCVFGEYKQALLIDGSFGAGKFYQSPAIGLGMHNHYKNQSLWLPLDFSELVSTKVDDVDKTFVYRKRFGEPQFLLPANGRFSQHLTDERRKTIASNILWLQKNPQIFREIISYHKEYKYPEVPNIDVDAALYQNGFIKQSEQVMCDRFHVALPTERIKLIERFQNQDLRLQAIRILGRNYPEILPDSFCREFDAYLQQIERGEVIDYRNRKHLTSKEVMEEIVKLKTDSSLTLVQQKLLDDLLKYIQS